MLHFFSVSVDSFAPAHLALRAASGFCYRCVWFAAFFYAWTNRAGARELRDAINQLDKKKESIRLEDFIPPPVPDEQNVAQAPIFREFSASERQSRLGRLTVPWTKTALPAAGEDRLPQIAKQINPSFSGDETSAARVVLDSLLPSELVLAELSEAVRRPQISWPLDYSKGIAADLPHRNPIWKASTMLQVRALAQLAAGAPQKAFEDVNTLLALAEISASPRLLICQFEAFRILERALDVLDDGLCRNSWSGSNLAAFPASLPQRNLVGQMADAYRMDRAMWQTIDWNHIKILGNRVPVDEVNDKWQVRIAGLVWRIRPAGWGNRDRALHLLLCQRLIEALGAEGSISPDEFRDIDSLSNNVSSLTTPVSSIFFPSMDGWAQRAAFVQTLLESTRTVIAAKR